MSVDQAPAGARPAEGPRPEREGPSGGTGEQSRRLGWLLAVTCVAQFMVILDLSIVNVALPSIQSSLDFTTNQLQWVVDAYSIVFAGFLMLGGRATDYFGQRRSFVLALGLFSVTSLVGGLSVSHDMLVAARAFQGLSGALMAAASLAIITSSFADGPARNRAIGLWGAMNGAGGAAGTVLGGVITQELSWRWILLINPPIGVAAALVAYRVVANRRSEGGRRFDLAGALSLTLGQLVLVYGIVDTGVDGWSSARAIGPMLAGAVLLAVFALVEVRFARAPLVPLRSLSRPLQVANLIVLLFSASLFAMWYVSSLYLQQVLGLSPLDAGLAFLPMTLVLMASASVAGKLVGRWGVRAVLGAGLVLMATGMLLMARIGPSGSALGYVVLPGLLTAAGIGLSVVPSTVFATQGAGPARAGLASGLVNTSRQVGGGVGLALLATLATQATSAAVGRNVAVPVALTQGFRLAYLVCASFVGAAIVVTFVLARAAAPAPAAASAAQSAALGAASPAEVPGRGAPVGLAAPVEAVGTAGAAGVVGVAEVARPDGIVTTAEVARRGGVARPGGPARVVKLGTVARRGRRASVPLATGLVVACFVALDFAVAGGAGPAIGAYTTKGAYSFVSAPGLHPPVIKNVVAPVTGALAPGYVMVANFYDISAPPMSGQGGPLILDSRLQPVWSQPVPKDVVASNLQEQTYHGHPVLTWWQGVVSSTGETESGQDVVVNQHYQRVASLQGQDGWVITMHEMLVRGNVAWVTANKAVRMNLSRYGGSSDGVLDDAAVQEYDLTTGKLLYSWDALDHIPLRDSKATLPTNGFPWDAYHVNSVDLVGPGRFLVSMRNTWAAYMVDAATGAVQWQLGGAHSSFAIPPDARFQFQHNVMWHSGDVVTMFDDNCCQLTGGGTYLAPAGPSRGLQLHLNMAAHTVTVMARYIYAKGYAAAYMGNMQLLPNGNVFIGWGSQPNFSEYSKSGKLLLNGVFPGSDLSYRAEVAEWTGLPLYPPSGAARRAGAGTTVYASWNGATGVVSWRVLAGTAVGDLGVVASSTRKGFETAVPVKGQYAVYEVQALGKSGKVLGTSKAFALPLSTAH